MWKSEMPPTGPVHPILYQSNKFPGHTSFIGMIFDYQIEHFEITVHLISI